MNEHELRHFTVTQIGLFPHVAFLFSFLLSLPCFHLGFHFPSSTITVVERCFISARKVAPVFGRKLPGW